jgi:hypothetical protein
MIEQKVLLSLDEEFTQKTTLIEICNPPKRFGTHSKKELSLSLYGLPTSGCDHTGLATIPISITAPTQNIDLFHGPYYQ